MTGGSADLSAIYVGDDPNGKSYGRLELLSSDAQFKVRGALRLGYGAALAATPGATVRMTGACQWQNVSSNPSGLAGLGNLGVVFEGQAGTAAEYEVAGEDLGASQSGFDTNFAMDRLELGGPAGAGALRLVDKSDNQPGWTGSEALYVNTLVLNEGAAIDLSGWNLYYANGGAPKQFFRGDCNLDGQVSIGDMGVVAAHWGCAGLCWAEADLNGDGVLNIADLGIMAACWGMSTPSPSPAPVPEPASLVLVCVGLPMLVRVRRKAQ
jgi:hypothetical protein